MQCDPVISVYTKHQKDPNPSITHRTTPNNTTHAWPQKSDPRLDLCSQEAQWHPLEAGPGRNPSTAAPTYGSQERGSLVSPPLSKDGADSLDNNNLGAGTADDLTYLRHLELEPVDPLTGLPLHPGFTAQGGRTPCTVTRVLTRPPASDNQVRPRRVLFCFLGEFVEFVG